MKLLQTWKRLVAKIRKPVIYAFGMAAVIGLVTGVSLAAFTDKAKVLGSVFSVGSANIMFVSDIQAVPNPLNYVDDLPGPTFSNIGQTWSEQYLLKVVNTGTYNQSLSTHAYYETINDPADLRESIYVEIFEWEDIDEDGVLDEYETGVSLGKKTIVKWKTEGFGLGEIAPDEIRSLILKFSTENLSSTKQGAEAIFDFEFDSVQL